MSGRRGHTVGIVQARTTSTRLPGKVLIDLEGEPMVLRQLERVARAASLDLIVVATSEDPSDDALAVAIAEAGYDLVRGSLDDVLARFVQVIDEYQPDVVVRMTADCPLICPSVIDGVVVAFHSSDDDYLSNTMDPTYPDGLDVEVTLANVLREVNRNTHDADEREHVTLGIYRHPERYRVANFVDPTGISNAHLRWTVDTAEDLEFVCSVYRELLPVRPEFGYLDVLDLLYDQPQLSRDDRDTHRNQALDGIDVGVMRHPGGGS